MPVLPPEDEVVEICRTLIRYDTSNYGDDTGPGERDAAEYVAGLLDEVGLETTIVEPAPRRTSVITRIKGADSSRPALVVHGHLDVVPAQKDEWGVDPFSGYTDESTLWGRGAVDMKNMDAMILAVIRSMVSVGRVPPRDLIVAFFADEEAGGINGARWIVENRPELFDGASEAISEVGGFSTYVGDQRVYLIQTGEKGMNVLRLRAQGQAGHGSLINRDNAITRLAGAVHRIGQYEWPETLTATTRQMIEGIRELVGDEEPVETAEDTAQLLTRSGSAKVLIEASLRATSNPTVVSAGYKHNVIARNAEAYIDTRHLPGQDPRTIVDVLTTVAGAGVSVESVFESAALETGFSAPLVEAMGAAILQEDPAARLLPYMFSGGTDNKSLARLGITGYGFAPLQLPADLDFPAMFHGVDERIPLESLRFGTRALDAFLNSC